MDAESPPLPHGRITEVAEVAQAFGAVQRTAVEAAVGQANLRKGVSQVFLNLSLRSQSLLHRQLHMLDAMERAASDPQALADLFRIDHLTTRMRRHAENLIILSGATPGRGWRDPVPVVDVLRAAVAEVEDYVRVDVASESRDAVLGAVVNDVIHLIAELIENATVFSPPTTQVEVRADRAGHGFVVEIQDRGLGLTDAEIAGINERLASPLEFDLVHSEQLGLFVVGQLAARHGIKVSLSSAPYGGIRAAVLLPPSAMAPAEDPSGSAGPGGGWRQAPEPADARSRSEPASAPPQPGAWQRPAGSPASGPAAPRGQQAATATSRSHADAGHADAGHADTGHADTGQDAGLTRLGLPVRVRQAGLAPQLRAGARQEPGGAPDAGQDGPSSRSPEHARSLMTALQDGWRPGRVDNLGNPVSRSGEPLDDTQPAGTDSSDGEAM